jgi:HEAT repeat protein
LRGEPVGGVFSSLVQTRIARAIGQIGRATPEVLNLVVDLLDWPYRETCLEAVRALGAIHRTIPDRAIRRLLELRRDPQSSELRRAADVALAEILSYENGMEDEA